ERELAALSEFMDLNLFRLDESQQHAVAPIVEKLRTELAATRARNVREFVTGIRAPTTIRLDAMLADDTVVPLTDVKAEQNVTRVLQITESPSKAWRALNESHVHARRRAAEKSRLEKEDLGAINDRVNDARLRIRDAEMNYAVSLLEHTDDIATLET